MENNAPVQVITVDPSGSHAATIGKVAQASCLPFLAELARGVTPESAWDLWMESGTPVAVISGRSRSGVAAATPGGRPEVAHETFCLPRQPSTFGTGEGPRIRVNPALSTADACAEVVKALWVMLRPKLEASPEPVMEWLRSGQPLSVAMDDSVRTARASWSES